MPLIDTISPPRGRAGTIITISGASFGPYEFDNIVTVDGQAATIITESEVEIVCEVPSGITEDSFVPVSVQRQDNFLQHSLTWWSCQDVGSFAKSASPLPGQHPGPGESRTAGDHSAVEAKDYHRLVDLAEWQANELAAGAGSLASHDGTNIASVAVGMDGQRLKANSGATPGLDYGDPAAEVTLLWGKQIDAANTGNGAMVANGDSSQTSTSEGETVAPITGTVGYLWVLVQEETGADTLDQVLLKINGSTVYDSGTGLALTQGQSHRVNAAQAVSAGDRVELHAIKSGTAAIMRLSGGVRIS